MPQKDGYLTNAGTTSRVKEGKGYPGGGEKPKAQCVADDADGGGAHGGRREDRVEPANRRDGNQDDVVDEGGEEILLDVAHGSLAQLNRRRHAAQIAADQRDVRRFHGHVRPGADRDPTSACARAGASLMPSPTMAARRPSPCRRFTSKAFASGKTSASTRSMPTSLATAAAVRGLSPVIITTSRPMTLSADTASRACFFTVSATAMTPTTVPPTATNMGVRPASASRAVSASRPATLRPSTSITRRLPTRTGWPFTVARMPCPGTAAKPLSGSSAMRNSRAIFAMASPIGCSEPSSADAANCNNFSRDHPSWRTTISLTASSPVVSVPVLSSTTVVSASACSKAAPLRIRIPSSAPRPIPTIIEVGVANPSAHGQAMISTATKFSSALVKAGAGPNASQRPNVSAARAMTIGTKNAATWSTSRAMGGFDPCASSTSRTIWASAVSAPTCVALKRKYPVLFSVAPMT